MKNKLFWFTLIELIVGITILSILWVVAFVSYTWYSSSARDSRRHSDTKNIQSSLDLFLTQRWRLPEPSNSVEVTYSWGIVFTQWTFWESTKINVGTFSRVPVDPLFWNEYAYSVDYKKTDYNISWIDETPGVAFLPVDSTYAASASSEIISRVEWTYNGQMAHTSTGWQVYVFSAPSLIVSDLSDTNILNLADKFVYDGEPNIPSSYSWAAIIQSGIFDFTPTLVYSGATLPKTPATLKVLTENLKDSVTGTLLYSKPEYQELIELNLEDSDDLFEYGNKFINKSLWGRFELNYPKNCKEILWTDADVGSGQYTISPNSAHKIDVYCDMDTDGGWWTRIRAWDRNLWYVDLKTINQTKGIIGSELMTQYTRYGTIRKQIGGVWQDVNVEWQKYGAYYKRFRTKQTEESGLCGEYTRLTDLIDHITSGSWGDCSRSCQRTIPGDNNSPCDDDLEYSDILIDDVGEDIGLSDDKLLAWFWNDPCINNGSKTSDRNVSWYSNGVVQHRIDSTTSLTTLWWANNSRCDGTYWSESRINDRWASRMSSRWITNPANYVSWYQTNEVYVR